MKMKRWVSHEITQFKSFYLEEEKKPVYKKKTIAKRKTK